PQHSPDRAVPCLSRLAPGRRPPQHEDQPRAACGMGRGTMSRALVTGGGGFLGLYIVEQLVARGGKVRVLCRGIYSRLAELNVECVIGDVRDAETVNRCCAGIDAVYHVAAVSGIWGRWKRYHGINTIGTENVLAACRAQHVPKLVYTSSP